MSDPSDQTDIPSNPTAGDNPNKTKASRSKKFRPTKLFEKSIPNVIEQVEPKIPLKAEVIGHEFTQMRYPGTKIVGTILLRPEFVDELIHMSRNIIDATLANVSARRNMAYPTELADFLVYYCLATQCYETLFITGQETASYKLKALKFAGIDVPDWLTPLVQAIGNYTTAEGVIQIRAIEQFVPYFTVKAITAGKALNLVDNSLLFTPDIVGGTYPLWSSSNKNRDMSDLLATNMRNSFLSINVIAGPATFVPVNVDLLHGPNPADMRIMVQNAMVTNIPTANRTFLSAFLNLRAAPVNTMFTNPALAADVATVGLIDGDATLSITNMIKDLGLLIPAFNTRFSYLICEQFKSTRFAPASGGSAAQFVVPEKNNANISLYDSTARHDYKMSPSSATIGLILIPANETEFSPEYSVGTELSRNQLATSYGRQFLKMP